MKFLSDTQIRTIRERRSMGETKQRLCLEFKISGGHLDRILNGTARLGAGGPLSSGELIQEAKIDVKRLSEMTDEERTAFILKGKETAGVKDLPPMPDLDRRMGKETPRMTTEYLKAELERIRKEKGQASIETPTTPDGYPLPPDWMENYGGQDEKRPNDPNELLDELMKK